MRDLLIVVIVFGSIPLIFVRPQIGILMWYWISLMNPHRLSWGYAYQLRVAMVIGLATILAWLMSRERKVPPLTAVTVFLAALTFWVSVSTAFAIVPQDAFEKWQEVIKILGMSFIATCIIGTKDRIIQAVWVIALSIDAYGVKGGIFGILTGGRYRVWGPPESFIEDNNQLGLALIMVLPLIHFLSIQSTTRWLRLGLNAGIALNIVAILCTYSRGGFVALAITLVAFLAKAKKRLLSGLFAIGVVAGALVVLPSSWYDRMYTIDHYERDESALGRLNAWGFALRLASEHPLTGGGFRVVDDSDLYFRYVPNADVVHNFHSIYFETLGEHGWVGLMLFLGLIISSIVTAQRIIRTVRVRSDLAWAGQLASAIQISIVGYCTAGAFVNLGFYDLYYALVAILVSTKFVVDRAVLAQPHRGLPEPMAAAASTMLAPPYAPQRLRS
jgi:probable O-glycosylation ligase (exosortase A-associated)